MMALPTDRAFLQPRTHQLYGGQAQRLALARALANEPSLIVLDEPTTDLDARAYAQVLEAIARAAAGATLVGSHDHITIDAVADRVVILSGLQRQRVAIARALAAGPRLLVCDEITSALDEHSATRVLELVVSLIDVDDLAVIVISHDHALVSHLADAVVTMVGGPI